jgi:hypothetical protein
VRPPEEEARRQRQHAASFGGFDMRTNGYGSSHADTPALSRIFKVSWP